MTFKENLTFLFICISIVVISFVLQIGLFPFLADTVQDYRSTKEFLGITCVVGIILWSIFVGHKIQCKNPGIVLLMGYILIHPFLTPPYTLELFHQNVAGFWQFKPVLYSFIYFIFFCIVANMDLIEKNYDQIFKVLYWVGFISALYALLQWLHLDEFQHLASWGNSLWTPHGNMTATFTHPNYSGAFLAMTIPLAIYLKKFWQAILMTIILILINGKMAIFGCICGIAYLIFSKNKWWALVYSLLIVASGWFLISHHQSDWTDSGRFAMWKLIFHDITQPWIAEKAFPLFGHGLGSFGTIWTSVHKGTMHEAHNEPLQYAFETGLIGLGLVIFSIFWLIKKINIFTLIDKQTVILFVCLVSILACSLGLFVWQIEPHRFISVLIFALLHNKVNQQGRIRQ